MNEEKEFIRRIVLQICKAKQEEISRCEKNTVEGVKESFLLNKITAPLMDICERYRGIVFDYKTEQPKTLGDIVTFSKEKLPLVTENKQEQNTLEKIASHIQSIDENLYKILLMKNCPSSDNYRRFRKTPYTEEELCACNNERRRIRDEIVSECTNRASNNRVIADD